MFCFVITWAWSKNSNAIHYGMNFTSTGRQCWRSSDQLCNPIPFHIVWLWQISRNNTNQNRNVMKITKQKRRENKTVKTNPWKSAISVSQKKKMFWIYLSLAPNVQIKIPIQIRNPSNTTVSVTPLVHVQSHTFMLVRSVRSVGRTWHRWS